MVKPVREVLAGQVVEQGLLMADPVTEARRAMDRLELQRAHRRAANLPMPAGGLFDEVARNEQELF